VQGSAAIANADSTQSGFTDYWYNTNLSNVKAEKVVSPGVTIMLGDGNDGKDVTDARYNRNLLPAAWLQNTKSPARRHLDGAMYAFADGHVKWFKPQDVGTKPVKQSNVTFSIR
jgi:prepilin-type processing-associated H-X9-DG protein